MRSQVEQLRVGEVQLLILNLKPTFLRAKSRAERGREALRSRFSCSWILRNHKNPCLNGIPTHHPFDILRRVALWRAQYDESCKLCSEGYCLSLASMVESVGA